MIGRHAPICAQSFELILITQRTAGTEAQAEEINLHLILIRCQLKSPDCGFAQSGERLSHACEAESGDQDLRGLRRTIRLRDEIVEARCWCRTKALGCDRGKPK